MFDHLLLIGFTAILLALVAMLLASVAPEVVYQLQQLQRSRPRARYRVWYLDPDREWRRSALLDREDAENLFAIFDDALQLERVTILKTRPVPPELLD